MLVDVSNLLVLCTLQSVTSQGNLNEHSFLPKQNFFIKLPLNEDQLIILLFKIS